jgi:hypothetical protein
MARTFSKDFPSNGVVAQRLGRKIPTRLVNCAVTPFPRTPNLYSSGVPKCLKSSSSNGVLS